MVLTPVSMQTKSGSNCKIGKPPHESWEEIGINLQQETSIDIGRLFLQISRRNDNEIVWSARGNCQEDKSFGKK